MTKPFRYTITPRGEVRLEMNHTTFFLNRRRAAELLRTIGAAVKEQGANESTEKLGRDPDAPTNVAPKIIRTLADLEALDPQTILDTLIEAPYRARDAVDAIGAGEWEGAWLPAVIIATGDHTRAARQALEQA